jgi:hypothetical protein
MIQGWLEPKSKNLSEKETKSKRTGVMAQVVEYLTSKSQVPSSILNTAKKRAGLEVTGPEFQSPAP